MTLRERKQATNGSTVADRAQLSLPTIEAGIGALLVLGIVSLVALGVPVPADDDQQLETYADDTATLLVTEFDDDGTTVDDLLRSEEAFEGGASALEDAVDELLPDNLLFRVETPHGVVGYEPPDGTTVGTATATTPHGELTVRVWYV